MGKKAAAVSLLVVFVFMAILFWAFYEDNLTMEDKLSEGCIPLTSDKYGIARSYTCPTTTTTTTTGAN